MRRDHILVLATPSKMKSIEGEILRIDTGDREVDNKLRGYIRIATDYREWRLARIDCES
jgi:predicted polyphosphate/ATP-dependent NAD kinase